MKFVNATLKSIESLEKVNTNRSLLSKIDPETKLISVFIVLFLMVFLRSLEALFLLLIFLIIESLIFERSVFRIWLFVPLFTGIIAIPALFITPGDPVFNFYFLSITYQGIIAATYLVVRTLIAVTCLALFTKTTKWEDIIGSLKMLKLPQNFILILFLTFRYIFFFARITENTLLSIKSRVIGKEKPLESWKMYAPLVGNLFIKSYDIEEKVYMAMYSRGFMIGDTKEDISKIKLNWSYIGIFIYLAFILLLINGDFRWILPN